MQNLLLQTTIEDTRDDWHIDRFSQLRAFLSGLRNANGEPAFRVAGVGSTVQHRSGV